MNNKLGKYNKYGNKKVIVDSIKFDSKKEARRYQELKLMLKANRIKDLELQRKFELIPKQTFSNQPNERAVSYLADFCYYDLVKNVNVIEDVKSAPTKKKASYVIKRKLIKWLYKKYEFRES